MIESGCISTGAGWDRIACMRYLAEEINSKVVRSAESCERGGKELDAAGTRWG